MGGHGALTLYLKHRDLFKSCSAFAPICNPINCPWGQKAFKGYLGDDESTWKKHDACEILTSDAHILIEQGTADKFLEGQLVPQNIEAKAKEIGADVKVNYREGYDHCYTFISTFVTDHIQYHFSMFQ